MPSATAATYRTSLEPRDSSLGGQSTASLKTIMTAPPMTAEEHNEIMRRRAENRRLNEIRRDEAQLEEESYGYSCRP